MPTELDDLLAAVRDFDLALELWRSLFARQYRLNGNDTLVVTALVAAGGPVRPRDIAEQLHITSGTLTSMLDRLERARLVERTPNPGDRRSILIALTERGESAVEQMRTEMRTAIGDAIDPQAFDRFGAGLRGLVITIGAATTRLAAVRR